jgi:hypothetical protein
MMEQLASPLYEVPQKLSQQWVQDEQILPLLDGLDEMEEAVRPACIAAINAYRRENPLCPLVVCSRSYEYAAASTHQRLHLQSAVEVQPLSPEQLKTTLLQAGKPFAALRTELKKNTDLRELARSPLWLKVLLLTFKDKPVQALPQRRSDLQLFLFEHYVQRMVEQKGDQKRYPLDKVVRWLSWLAKQMRVHDQSVFAVELLQPDWLKKRQQIVYQWSAGLFFGLIAGAMAWLVLGLLLGLILGVFWGLAEGLIFGLIVGLISSLIFGLILGLAVRQRVRRNPQIKLAERISWSWKNAGNGLRRGLILGLISGLICGLLWGPVAGLLFGPFITLPTGLTAGIIPLQSLERRAILPGESIRRSLRNGLFVALLFGLVGVLVGMLVGALTRTLALGLLFGSMVVSAFMLNGGLVGGLLAVIQHASLLLCLSRSDSFPLQAGDFLEDARARHLLQRFGGTYRFVHPLLQDHFAGLGGDASEATEALGTPVLVVTSDDT